MLKISSLKFDHPVKRFAEKRQIPSKVHYELFYAPKFYEWVNKIIPNKFPSLKGDHPRLVIPFLDESNKMFAFQGRAFGNEIPKSTIIHRSGELETIDQQLKTKMVISIPNYIMQNYPLLHLKYHKIIKLKNEIRNY